MHLAHLMALGALAAAVACGGSSTPTGTGTNSGGGTGGTGGGGSGSVGVTVQDFSFAPESITIKAGMTVQWTNKGPSAHTTTSDSGVWGSPVLAAPSGSAGGTYGGGGGTAAGTFQFTFNQAGTYRYHCSIHPPSIYPNFKGVIVVTP
jgi:plastocyanin